MDMVYTSFDGRFLRHSVVILVIMDMVYEKSLCFFVRCVTHPLNPPPVRGTYDLRLNQPIAYLCYKQPKVVVKNV